MRDVPRTSYVIGRESFGCVTGDRAGENIRQKQVRWSSPFLSVWCHKKDLLSWLCHLPPRQAAIAALALSLPFPLESAKVADEFAFHILNESCTTVTNTASKTAVQLVFGKANLVCCVHMHMHM